MEKVVIRGGGDIASGIAHRLFKAGFKVVILEIEKPTNIRREVSFAEAIYRGEIEIEGVRAIKTSSLDEINLAMEKGIIAVYIDEKADIISKIKPQVVVDSILAKKNLGTNKNMADISIGVGPGFNAGLDLDLVVETKRGHYLGRVIEEGEAIRNTGIPGNIIGFREERIIRASGDGIVDNFYKIGDQVKKGDIICKISGLEVRANIDGVIRGLIKEGLYVKESMKIGDIDPRGIREYAYTISDKARAVAGGVLEGIMMMKRGRE